jgi:hypothetical protein
MTSSRRKRPEAFDELGEYSKSNGEGLRADCLRIYPVGAKFATDAWFAPVIVYDEIVLWHGEPEDDPTTARRQAKKYLVFRLKELLNPFASKGIPKLMDEPDQLF